MINNTTRFSDRVDDYVKYRPGYPQQILSILKKNIGLEKTSIIADIGSGTGISSGLFIQEGYRLYGVEPNKEMRKAAESSFSKYKNYISINGTAEKTTLYDKSIDIIFSAQAFHWFNQPETKKEFKRILKPGGHIVLVWNIRIEKNDFQKEYEKLLKTIPGYNDVTHRNIADKEIINFFSPRTMYKECLDNFQQLSLDGLKGRMRSSSYSPKSGKEYENLMNALGSLFSKYEKNDLIEFQYETAIFWC